MKHQLLLIAATVLAGQVSAHRLDAQQAQQRAAQFLSPTARMARGYQTTSPAAVTLAHTGPQANYYVFNSTNTDGGFVIVSGSTLTYQVLAYSDTGTFKATDMPANIATWLNSYSDQVQALEDGTATPRTTTVLGGFPAEFKAIAPMIRTQWAQWPPYSDQCPDNSVTGCVPTAMAQLMYYWQHPKTIPNDVPAHSTLSAVSAGTAIDFSNMLLTDMDYQYGTPTEENMQAVAFLMRLCGQSVQVSWGTEGSGASSAFIPMALRMYFGYDYRAHEVSHADTWFYSDQEWEELLYNELEQGRPVVYSGYGPTSGGHSFIIDGYDPGNEQGFYHVNWGWGGADDGFYSLTAMKPRDINTSYDFSQQHAMVIGIQPAKQEDNPPVMTIDEFTPMVNNVPDGFPVWEQSNYPLELTRDDQGYFNTLFLCVFFNNATQTYPVTMDFAIAIYKDGQPIGQPIAAFYNNDIGGWEPEGQQWSLNKAYWANYVNIAFGKGLPDGEYEIHALNRPTGTEQWYPLYYDDTSYIIATITGDKCQLSDGPMRLHTDDTPPGPSDPDIPGDVNGDGHVDVGDIMAVINIMAASPPVEPEPGNPADVNADGHIDVGDIMAIINIMANSN